MNREQSVALSPHHPVSPSPWGAVILAAGRSSRMGEPKLLLEWSGKSLLRRAVEAAIESGAAEIVVVLGDRAEMLEPEVPLGRARVVHNAKYAQGQSTSLRCGLSALGSTIESAVLYPADQPFVTAPVLRRLVGAQQRSRRPIVVAESAGIRGAPALFTRRVFPELMRLEGDQGARELVRGSPELVHVERFDDPNLMLDVDTPEDYHKLQALAPQPAERPK